MTLGVFLLCVGASGMLATEMRGAPANERLFPERSSVVDTIHAPKRVDLATLSGVGGTLVPVAGGTVLIDRANETYELNREERAGRLGMASLAVGLLVGPSLGHFYAQNHDQAWTGLAMRGGAIVSGTLALWAYPLPKVEATPDRASSSGDKSTIRGILGWVMVGSAAVLVFRSFYDLASTPQSVHDYNAQPDVRASVVPHVAPTAEGAGLTVRVQF